MTRVSPRTPEQAARDRELSRSRAASRRHANREQYNANMRTYETKNADRINAQRRSRHSVTTEVLAERPFIGWDGEGYSVFIGHVDSPPEIEHRYMLFGCSMYPDSPLIGQKLSTKACLDYLLWVESQHPDSYHVGFAFDYDVNMILTDLESRHLRHLASYGVVHWRDYTIRHAPGKYLRVSRIINGVQVTATIDDMFSFFHTSYVKALLKFGVTTKEEITRIEEGKKKRGSFRFDNIDYVKRYWQDEISYFPDLASCIREACYDGGFYIRRWFGPGVLSTYMLSRHKVQQWHSKDVPIEVQLAIPYAFAGGRFQPWQCGLWYHDIHTADINSAYIYACSLLPRLDNGRWRRQRQVDRKYIARFGLYHISYNAGRKKLKAAREAGNIAPINPLFHRSKNGVCWPATVDGWYWSPEAELVANDPDAQFLEAWIYEDDGTYPFTWVSDAFDQRLLLQRLGNPAEKTLKWALASMYGKFAQTVGWDKRNRKPPRNHELAWAGFITSWCRAEMYRVGYECWKRGGLISIDTDGITSSIPFEPAWLNRGIGDKLGQWKLEEFHGILYWQTGLYWMLDADGNWTTAKTRGFKRGSLDVSVAFTALDSGRRNPVIEKHGNRFIGYKDSINRGNLDNWKQWVEIKQQAKMGVGNAYTHTGFTCPKCKNPEQDTMHYLWHGPLSRSAISEPRRLPWLEVQDGMPENIIEMFDGDGEIIPRNQEADYLGGT